MNKGYSKLNRWFVEQRMGWVLAACVVLLLGARLGFVESQKPRHIREIARAHGYSAPVYGVPQVNKEASQLTYCQLADDGIGVFVMDLASGRKKAVYTTVPADQGGGNVAVWPWSPDGKYFIFTHRNLFVCDGTTHKVAGNLRIEGLDEVASLVWLSASSFVCVSRDGSVHRIESERDGHWKEVVSRPVKAGTQGLTAISRDTVCWQNNDRIWGLNLISNVAKVLFDAGTNRLEGFAYSQQTRQFLVSLRGKAAGALWQMSLGSTGLEHQQQICEIESSAASLAWLEGEHGVSAFISTTRNQPEQRVLRVLPKAAAKPVTLFAEGMVETIAGSGDGRKLYVVGCISNEPSSGIWEYDAHSGTLKGVVSGVDYPSARAMRINARQETVNLNGNFNYHIYEPAGLNPNARKRYPVVIGDTLFNTLEPVYQNRAHGAYWAPMLANGGAYVVIVERPGAWFNEIGQWENRVNWVYEKLMRNPTIDPHQVFLFATSEETPHLNVLAHAHPERWKGLLLLNPTEFPDLPVLSAGGVPPKILISQGALEGTNRSHLYQIDAAKYGVRVELCTHERAGRILMDKQALGSRAEAMMQFVFED